MELVVDLKVLWLSLEQFCSHKGLHFPKQSALKLPAWAEAAKGAGIGCVLLAASNGWQTEVSALPVFQQWKIRAVPSEKSFCCLAMPQACRSIQQDAEGVLCPLGWGKNVLQQVCAVEKVPTLCSLLLDFKEVSVPPSESMGFCSHSLEGHPNKVKSSFYSALLDKVGFLTWDTGVGSSMWNTWGALQWNKPSTGPLILCFAFFCAMND